DRLVEGLFVFAKVLPVLLFEPGRISSDSHAGVAAGQCASELLMPGANHSLQIKRAILEIPLAGGDNLYAVACQVAIKLGDGLIQRMLGFVNRHGLGNHPQAELFAFQSSLAIGDQRVEDIVFRLVEEAKMCAPGHVADDVDSGLPHLVCHRDHLPVFILGIAAANPRGFRLSRSAAPAAAAGRLKENVAPDPAAPRPKKPSTASTRRSATFSGGVRFASPRTRSMMALARSASLTMSAKASRTSSRPWRPLGSRPRHALALLTMAASGWFSSWAKEAVTSPSVVTRVTCVSAACASRKASEASQCSVRSRLITRAASTRPESGRRGEQVTPR